MKLTTTIIGSAIALAVFGMLVGIPAASVDAAPPHPGLVQRVVAGETTAPYFMCNLDAMRAKGIGVPAANIVSQEISPGRLPHRSPGFTGPFKILAILVEFSDNSSIVAPAFYDSLIFGTEGNTIKDYYSDISFGQIDLVSVNLPSTTGWRTAPQTYAYYVNNNNGTGSYPNNTQKLVEDLVDQVDPLVDFTEYDNDGNGSVDILLVVHAGTGAEYSGGNDDIWSHKWSISPRYKDGVYISAFTVQPEYWASPGDMTIGIYSHELGHGFGLPDLYDTDYSSTGIGKWGIMSYGSWLGPRGLGGSPAHFCAWSKIQMGILTPVNISANTYSQAIANAEDNPAAYRLWNAGATSDEYFLVENRQKIGYDSYLPSSGLLIWHIDDAKDGNDAEWYPGLSAAQHYEVALEQADGLYEMEKDIDNGDTGDPYPGSYGRTSFNAVSTPNSDSYSGATSFVSVENISASASTMYADLMVGFSAEADSGDDSEGPSLPVTTELAQNYPNPFNPTTTITFSTTDADRATIEVFNTLGERVATVFDRFVSPGITATTWDGTSDRGCQVASGVYFYRLKVGESEQSRKMVLIR
ncbi:MAG: M6 family metalloprotease domain-containing protein [candidate division Zixibacteria bacterium]|nr:M6 family metalloprotease domain-containing protein [candidate division Zixibacteria bacterium]